jgi:hypothetical protein
MRRECKKPFEWRFRTKVGRTPNSWGKGEDDIGCDNQRGKKYKIEAAIAYCSEIVKRRWCPVVCL